MDRIERQHLDHHLSALKIRNQDQCSATTLDPAHDSTDTTPKITTRSTRSKLRQIATPVLAQLDQGHRRADSTEAHPSLPPRRSSRFSHPGPGVEVDPSEAGPSGKGKEKVPIDEAEFTGTNRK